MRTPEPHTAALFIENVTNNLSYTICEPEVRGYMLTPPFLSFAQGCPCFCPCFGGQILKCVLLCIYMLPHQELDTFCINFIFKGSGLEIAMCSVVAKNISEKTPKICTADVISLPNKLVQKITKP